MNSSIRPTMPTTIASAPMPSSARTAARAAASGLNCSSRMPLAITASCDSAQSRCSRACWAVTVDTATNELTSRAAWRRSMRWPREPGLTPCLEWIATAPISRAAGAP